jgi:endonuclease/exonuclease/phosphatase family metal-dependent hydrolase
LAVAHLPSKQAHRDSVVQEVAGDLRRTEQIRGHSRTVVVGDFNRSPFDDVMVDALGFHALMTRDLASRRHLRTVAGVEYPTFFNPMWRFLTDRASQPAGTYYFHESAPANHFWYALDQVLVRTELMDKLSAVEVLESDGTDSLLDGKNLWPDQAAGSDHLPLLVRLDW